MTADGGRLVTEVRVAGMPAPVGHYSDATILGDQIFVSGLLALDTDGRLVGEDAGGQATCIFDTLQRLLSGLGGDLADVAKLTFYLTDLADRAMVNEVRKRVFGPHRPASTLVQVAGLIGAGTRLEVEAVAGLRRASR